MFTKKNNYFLIIESIKDIELRNINKYNKFIIIYRNKVTVDNINDLLKFRKTCKIKFIEFYVANDFKLSILLNSDGIYLSSYNKTFRSLNFKNSNYKIIGSAHNVKEIALKIKQGCGYILLSKLFKVDYDKSSNFLGINKFNTYVKNIYNELVPLGGIKISNLNSLKNLNCNCIALLSEVKKKPANIINRLF